MGKHNNRKRFRGKSIRSNPMDVEEVIVENGSSTNGEVGEDVLSKITSQLQSGKSLRINLKLFNWQNEILCIHWQHVLKLIASCKLRKMIQIYCIAERSSGKCLSIWIMWKIHYWGKLEELVSDTGSMPSILAIFDVWAPLLGEDISRPVILNNTVD